MKTARNSPAPRVLVAVAFHRPEQPLLRAVRSALTIKGVEATVLVLDSTPGSVARARLRALSGAGHIVCRKSRCRSAYSARNQLIRIGNTLARSHDWIIRLDADDKITSGADIAQVLASHHKSKGAVLFGNNQVGRSGRITGRNMPCDRLLSRDYLLRRLDRMASGDFKAELPSCNLVLRLPTRWRYPSLLSAEDHALLAEICLKTPADLAVVRHVTLVDYNLVGATTDLNLRNERYLSARRTILRMARMWTSK